jgi:Purple acid Phosphatase, N-terminal domain
MAKFLSRPAAALILGVIGFAAEGARAANPPSISEVMAAVTSPTTATITWTTNEPADSEVLYTNRIPGPRAKLSRMSSASVREHSVELTDLNSASTYDYRVASKNALWSAISPSQSFYLTISPNTIPVLPIGRFDFWFYGPSAISVVLQGNHAGITAITPGHQSDMLASADAIHATGMAEMAQMVPVDDLFSDPNRVIGYEHTIDGYAKSGIDAVVMTEAAGHFEPAFFTTGVQVYNALGDYWKSKRPGGRWGITIGEVGGTDARGLDGGIEMIRDLLEAGLKVDFVAFEGYGSLAVHPFDDLKKEFPKVQTMFLLYGTTALCANKDGAINELTYPETWSFWDLDNYGAWVGPEMDADWPSNAARFAATGDRSFCNLPLSMIPSSDTSDSKVADFSVQFRDRATIYPTAMVGDPPVLGRCEYRVVSGPHIDNPLIGGGATSDTGWLSRACNGTVMITLGPGKECQDNGPASCFVCARAYTATGVAGDTHYGRFNIAYGSTPPFGVGDRVEVRHGRIPVTVSPNSKDSLGRYLPVGATQSRLALGTVVAGPTVADDGERWWQIDFDSGARGWAAEGGLGK